MNSQELQRCHRPSDRSELSGGVGSVLFPHLAQYFVQFEVNGRDRVAMSLTVFARVITFGG
jgi:hypothetical protein